MVIKIFWQEQCPNCPLAKELGKKLEQDEGMDVIYYNLKETDGLAESLMYDVMSTPSIIVCDVQNNEIFSWRGDVPSLDEVKRFAN